MFDLKRYRMEIVNDNLRMEIFCDDLMDNFETRDDAETWFIHEFMPCWDYVIEEHFEEEDSVTASPAKREERL